MDKKKFPKHKLLKEFAREKWGHFMASNILKNNSFGGPTYILTDGGPPAWAVEKRAETGLAK